MCHSNCKYDGAAPPDWTLQSFYTNLHGGSFQRNLATVSLLGLLELYLHLDLYLGLDLGNKDKGLDLDLD